MYCENCGNNNLDNDKFCENCGETLNKKILNDDPIQSNQKFKLINLIAFILLIANVSIYYSNNVLSTEIKEIAYSNKEIQNLISKRTNPQSNSYTSENSSSNNINCSRVGHDGALWNYCESNSCDGFSNNHGLWTLCEQNSANGLSGNFGVWNYLETGNTAAFSGTAYKGAEQNKGSFSTRKRFIIYYLRGYIYYH